MARNSAARVRAEAAQRAGPTREKFALVWSAENPDAPAKLERRAARHLVAFYRGYMCSSAGEYGKAINLFAEAIALKPDFAEAHNDIGACLAEVGELSDAIPFLRKSVELNPNFASAHFNLGRVLSETGEFMDAIPHYRIAIKFQPSFVEAYTNLGFALAATRQLTEAIAVGRKAVELRPDDPITHTNLGGSLVFAGQFAEATVSYCNALEVAQTVGWSQYIAKAIKKVVQIVRDLTLDEGEQPDYIKDALNERSILLSIALGSGLRPEQLQKAIDNYRAANTETTTRETTVRGDAETRPADRSTAEQIFAEAAAKSSRRKTRYDFTEAELRDPDEVNRARDTLSDIETARSKGKISDEQRQAYNRAKAFIRKVGQLNAA